MKLIRLSDGCYVNPEDVQELTIPDQGRGSSITVRMRSGVGHYVQADYGKGVYATLDRLKKELEASKE